jgi:hypothetical protein
MSEPTWSGAVAGRPRASCSAEWPMRSLAERIPNASARGTMRACTRCPIERGCGPRVRVAGLVRRTALLAANRNWHATQHATHKPGAPAHARPGSPTAAHAPVHPGMQVPPRLAAAPGPGLRCDVSGYARRSDRQIRPPPTSASAPARLDSPRAIAARRARPPYQGSQAHS